jgi:hypothetical protein
MQPKVSPLRNLIGLVVLLAVITVGVVEVMANMGFNNAVNALNGKLKDVELGPSQPEVEKLMGKTPDGPGVREGSESRVRYTWRGVFRSYSLVAYYTTGENPPHLLRVE